MGLDVAALYSCCTGWWVPYHGSGCSDPYWGLEVQFVLLLAGTGHWVLGERRNWEPHFQLSGGCPPVRVGAAGVLGDEESRRGSGCCWPHPVLGAGSLITEVGARVPAGC